MLFRGDVDVFGLLGGLGGLGANDAPPYTEPVGHVHLNADGSECLVWSRDFCGELLPCEPGTRRGDPAYGENPVLCYALAGDFCEAVVVNGFVKCRYGGVVHDYSYIPEWVSPDIVPVGTQVKWAIPGETTVRLLGTVMSESQTGRPAAAVPGHGRLPGRGRLLDALLPRQRPGRLPRRELPASDGAVVGGNLSGVRREEAHQ